MRFGSIPGQPINKKRKDVIDDMAGYYNYPFYTAMDAGLSVKQSPIGWLSSILRDGIMAVRENWIIRLPVTQENGIRAPA